MSIPPLVCSTPPPPDQCDEDKDPEDFGLQYNLSQDDDDESNNYDYGNFSSHNHYQSPTCNEEDLKDTSSNVHNMNNYEDEQTTEYENKGSDGSKNKDEFFLGATESNGKCDEDTNIEDLGLKLNNESMISDINDNGEDSEMQNKLDSSTKFVDIPNVTNHVIVESVNSIQPSEGTNAEATHSSNDIDLFVEDITIDEPKEQCDGLEMEVNIVSTPKIVSDNDILSNKPIQSLKEMESVVDDDFRDFDDFQFIEPKSTNILEDSNNPWENNTDDDSDFGNFTANFDKHESNLQSQLSQETENTVEIRQSDNNVMQTYSEDDDFGDFDDFKSSAIEKEEFTPDISQSSQQVPVLNLQSLDNEQQVIENINKVLSSLFEEEIFEPESEFEGKLEALLSETWGHLVETDVRQPYIVTWNNSLGQKTLLKALCIDSRNILFGPKWSYNMPKFAANLSSAPLQPQKQMAASNISQNDMATSAPKAGDWADPFTSNGQESCNTESATPVPEINSADREAFESTTKISAKIYSSNLNIKQLRQINLPDTHIFTPTDSETPRSKTIHYDSGPPVLLPQSVTEESKRTEDCNDQQVIDTVVKDAADEQEYWEFQDFKSTSDVNATSITTSSRQEQSHEKKHDNINAGNILTQTVNQNQVLLPVKMEPTMPTLNWPDPGKVKETFDDFSDFLSHSSWVSEKPDATHITSLEKKNIESNSETDSSSKIYNDHKVMQEIEEKETKSNDVTDLDDEFDTFQSALPPKNTTVGLSFNSLINQTINSESTSQNISPQISSGQLQDLNFAFPKNIIDKSDTISVTNVTKSNEALKQPLGFYSNSTESTTNSSSMSSGMQPNLLQPLPASYNSISHSQQKSGQILQPLSLESYSQINWPSPGIDLQDLSRFNPVETLQSLKSDLGVTGHKGASPIHSQKSGINQAPDDDVWGEFVSSKPKPQQALSKKSTVFVDDDEWTDFVSSPSVKPQNGLMNTISLNVHTNSNIQKTSNQNKFSIKSNQIPIDVPVLNYITPKASNHNSYNDKHFQNL